MQNPVQIKDPEVEQSVRQQLDSFLDDYELEESVFYSSEVLMVYSYFESILRLILFSEAKKRNSKELLKAVYAICGEGISEEEKVNNLKFEYEFSLIRNQLCHNNNGTSNPNSVSFLTEYANKTEGVYYENEELVFSNQEAILQLLHKTNSILLEITKVLGYKTKRI